MLFRSVRVTAASGLSQGDIDRIISEADSQRESDARRKELAEARVAAESLIYTTRRAVEEYGDVISRTDIEVIQADLFALEQAVEGEDLDLINELRAQLEASAFRIAEAMYANAEGDDDLEAGAAAPKGATDDEEGSGEV